MSSQNIIRLLVLGIALLLVTNITTIIGIVMYLKADETVSKEKSVEHNDFVNMPRGQFFKSELGLDREQTFLFRDLYHQYKEDASRISIEMEILRKEMIDELIVKNPDSLLLQEVAINIGDLHKQLKELTFSYFLKMKNNCTPEQEIKLHEIFNSLLTKQGDVLLPIGQGQGQRRLGRNKMNHQNSNNSLNN